MVPIQPDHSLIVNIYSFYNIDGIACLNKLKTKIKNNQNLDYSDVAFLKFSTLTYGNFKKHEMLIEAIKITAQDTTLPEEIRLKIELVQKKVCEKYIDKKYKKEVEEAFGMKTLKQELIDQVTEDVTRDVSQDYIKAMKESNLDEATINQILKNVREKRMKVN